MVMHPDILAPAESWRIRKPAARGRRGIVVAQAREGDRPILAAGASGGRRILAATFQLMTYVADFGMDPEAAAHAPRIDVSGPDSVTADAALDAATRAALDADAPTEILRRGILPGNVASPNLILAAPDGTRIGIGDDRSPWATALAQEDREPGEGAANPAATGS
jgi:gamma-glutamyltranspeptidase/glutathione hydrolase